jgi:REP element-mobilizing transposase RayT
MSSTYTKIYIHIGFAVKERNSLIKPVWEEQLFKYITGIVQNREQKMLAINGMPDHIHFLIGMKPNCNLSDLVREVKKSSNQFIRISNYCNNFYWQHGFGAFSYGQSQLNTVIGYIMNQKEHHKKISFKDEYLNLLQKLKIDYEEKYIFKWVE